MIINLTDEDLKSVKGIIYMITNKCDGKTYIGKTKHSFSGRYTKYRLIIINFVK